MSERARVAYREESDRAYVTAEDGSDKVTVYYYADAETAEQPFCITYGPHGGEFYVEMSTIEFAKWLHNLNKMFHDAQRDGR